MGTALAIGGAALVGGYSASKQAKAAKSSAKSSSAAEERIAALMLSISTRNARRKLSSTSFRLPMSRIDIGNYLGLTVETVSRVFSRLQKLAVLEVSNKEIEILDIEDLQDIANVVIES